jgi:hypothetical protein
MTQPAQRIVRVIDLIGLTVCVGLAALAYKLIVDPIQRELAMIGRTAGERADLAREVRVAETGLVGAGREVAELQGTLDASDVKLVTAAKLNDRMVHWTTLAAQHGVSVQQLTPSRSAPVGMHVIVGIKLAGTTSYSAAAGFLAEIRKTFPDTRVDGLKLVSDPASGTAALSLECSWYTIPVAATEPARTPPRAVDAGDAGRSDRNDSASASER